MKVMLGNIIRLEKQQLKILYGQTKIILGLFIISLLDLRINTWYNKDSQEVGIHANDAR